MKMSQVTSSVFLLVLTLSFSVSFGALSSIFEVTPVVEDIVSCIRSNSNNFPFISQQILTPANSSFLPTWGARVNNLRYNKTSTPKPSIIVTPVDENQVRTTLLCAKRYGYEFRVRCGGHDFEGLSSSADVPFVMLDLYNMRSVHVDVANSTAVVQGGAVLGRLYYEISQKTNTLYFPGALCPTVGVGGYLSGGGYGLLTRKYGTGSDHVVDVRFMDVNGTIHDRKSMGEDLFWAIRGGGASNFGIVLNWTLSLLPVPEYVTTFLVDITLEQGATEILHKFQTVVPKGDHNLLMRVQIRSEIILNTTQKTIRMSFFGLYLGSTDVMLSYLDQRFPELNVTRDICETVRMVQATLIFAGFKSSTSTDVLANRTTPIVLNHKNKLDYVRKPIPISGLNRIWRKMFQNDLSEILVMHTFGGRMEEIPETEIPYPHRAGVLYQFHQMVSFYDQASDSTPVSVRRINWLRSFNDLIAPYVSRYPREAYLNYNDLDFGVGSSNYGEASVWGERYWKRANFKKLIRIKAKVDPDNFFRHPQSIPVFPKLPKSRSDI